MTAIKERNRLQGWGKPARNPAENPSAGASSAGLTLIEVLLALAIFSIGLLATAGMQTSTVSRNFSSRMNTMAVEYASDYMECLLGLGVGTDIADVLSYPHLDAGTHVPDDFAGEDHDGDGLDDIMAHPEFANLFDLSWTVADGFSGSGTAAPGAVKRITVTVSWANGNKEISLTSIKATAL